MPDPPPSPGPPPAHNGAEHARGDAPPSLDDLVNEAEALRGVLQSAAARLGRLVAGLKQQRRQARAVDAALVSLRQMRPRGP